MVGLLPVLGVDGKTTINELVTRVIGREGIDGQCRGVSRDCHWNGLDGRKLALLSVVSAGIKIALETRGTRTSVWAPKNREPYCFDDFLRELEDSPLLQPPLVEPELPEPGPRAQVEPAAKVSCIA